jgi:hypothetical protein
MQCSLHQGPGRPKQNTGDLQWKFDANYNARLCEGERKAAGARTMASNGKTMRKAMETVGICARNQRPIVTDAIPTLAPIYDAPTEIIAFSRFVLPNRPVRRKPPRSHRTA